MRRDADDFLIQGERREEAEAAPQTEREWTGKRGLPWHPEKTRIVEPRGRGSVRVPGGYRFVQGKKWPRRKSAAKVRRGSRAKPPRPSGKSRQEIITEVNRVIAGWPEYFPRSEQPQPAGKSGRGGEEKTERHPEPKEPKERNLPRARAGPPKMAQRLVHEGRVVWPKSSLEKAPRRIPLRGKLLTGEPDAGEPPVRFGGRSGE